MKSKYNLSYLYVNYSIKYYLCIIMIIIIINYTASLQVHGLLLLPYFHVINCHFHNFRSSASSLLQLSIYFPVSQIIKQLYSSSPPYSFHFCHLSFNSIMKKVISSQDMSNLIDFSIHGIVQKYPLISLLATFPDHFISLIFLQHHNFKTLQILVF